jgi:hypothetical protein
MTPPATYAAEYRPRGRRGVWRLLAVRPTEGACWDELLAAPELRNCDLRVRALRRVAARGDDLPAIAPSVPPRRPRQPELFP